MEGKRSRVLLLGMLGLIGAAACGGNSSTPETVRLGYFANVTHAPALVGVSQGHIARELGDTKLSTQVFNAGPAAIEALLSGAIDATYIGPNPAINAFACASLKNRNFIRSSTASSDEPDRTKTI